MKRKNMATLFAILSASLYAINIPLSKMLLKYVDATMMAAFLYLGAGIGMIIYQYINKKFRNLEKKEALTKRELPYTIAMVLLDIIAPILLMFGISKTNSANVSLLNNFEIVATSMIAFIVFKEKISKRLSFAIVLVTIASIILSFEKEGSLVFNLGSFLVIGACICWGFENNCTKMISNKSSEEIVIIKGCFSGIGSLIIALTIGEKFPHLIWICAVLLLGFLGYGIGINFYIMAQKDLGAAKTSAYYSIAPFLGVAFSIILLKERPSLQFYISFLIMAVSTFIMVKDTISLQHSHEHTHSHSHLHRHNGISHEHEHIHSHNHLHIHGEDVENHKHNYKTIVEEHNHKHG